MIHLATLACIAHFTQFVLTTKINVHGTQRNESYLHKDNQYNLRLIKRGSTSLKQKILAKNILTLPGVILKRPVAGKNVKKCKSCCDKKNHHHPGIPMIEVSRQNDLEKYKKGQYKTYLDTIAEKERAFYKTSTTMRVTTCACQKTTVFSCDKLSTVFRGVIACPFNNVKVEYDLWVRPNRKRRMVKPKCINKFWCKKYPLKSGFGD